MAVHARERARKAHALKTSAALSSAQTAGSTDPLRGEIPLLDTSADPTQRLQRASGEVRLAFHARDGQTHIHDLYQVGCCKVRFPRAEAGHDKQAVLLNTAGGLTDGDRIATRVTWHEETTATLSTQAAERIYRSRQAVSTINTVLRVEAGATAFWLPQETILFDGARLARETGVDLHPTARFLGLECLVFGRAAMGEIMDHGSLCDRWRVRVAGRLVYADNFGMDGEIGQTLASAAIGARAAAVATVLYIGADAAGLLDRVRDLLAKSQGLTAGATARNGVLIVRLVARRADRIRAAIVVIVNALRLSMLRGSGAKLPPGGLMPRVWAL